MRYWVFQNFRVTGPFEVDALGRIAGFSATTLVCLDLRSGMDAEHWTRAGAVPELAAALNPALRQAPAPHAVRAPGPPAPPPGMESLSALETLRERVRDLEAGACELRAGQAAKDLELARLKARAEAEERAAGELKAKLAGFEAVGAEPGAVEDQMRELAGEARELRGACAKLREKLILRDAEAVRLEAADERSRRRAEDLEAKLAALKAERAASPASGAELEQVRQEARAALVRVLELRLILKTLEERAGLAPAAHPPEAAPAEPPASPPAPASRRAVLAAAAAGGLAGAAVALAVSLLSAPAKAPGEPPPQAAEKTPPVPAPAAAPKVRSAVPDLGKSTAAVQAEEESEAPDLPSIYEASRRTALPPGW